MLKEEKQKHHFLLYSTILALSVYLGWRLFFTLPFQYGWVSLFFGIVLFLSEASAMVEVIVQYINVAKRAVPSLPVIPKQWYPDVDILITTHNEPTSLLFKTANAAKYLDYPDPSKVHVYLCDDSMRPDVKEFAQEIDIGYIGLSGNKHAKAGNLNHAMANTSSPLVVTVDADMILRHEFLMKTVPYFFLPRLKQNKAGEWLERPKEEVDPGYNIGFIQTPQSFYNPDLFQYNLHQEMDLPNEQDFFFQDINVGRNATNSAIYAGSNTVLSRQALEDAGGFATETVTEDFETGMNIQSAGYTTYAVPIVLAHGMAPLTIKSLLSQRKRWARGCIQSIKKARIFTSKSINFSRKLSYLLTATYWWSFFRRMVYILSPLLFVFAGIRVVNASVLSILIVWVPTHLVYRQTLNKLAGDKRNQHWSNVFDTIMCPFLVLPVLLETLGFKQRKFVVTKKTRSHVSSAQSVLYAVPHILLLALCILAVVRCVLLAVVGGWYLYTVIVFWLAVNAKNLLFSIIFMLGRKNYREQERFYVTIPVRVEPEARNFAAMTTDISEGGLALTLKRPEFLPDDEAVTLNPYTERYNAVLSGMVVSVTQMADSRWKYSFQTRPKDQDSKNEYFQIVYDRQHTLATKLNVSKTPVTVIRQNIHVRRTSLKTYSRKLPRISLNLPVVFQCGASATLVDYDYKYMALDHFAPGENAQPDGRLAFSPAPGLTLRLKPAPTQDFSRHPQQRIYEVEDYKAVSLDPRLNEFIDRAMLESKR